MVDYWLNYSERVEKGDLVIVLQMSGDKTSSSDNENEEVCGYVGLDMPPGETGPFRGHVVVSVMPALL